MIPETPQPSPRRRSDMFRQVSNPVAGTATYNRFGIKELQSTLIVLPDCSGAEVQTHSHAGTDNYFTYRCLGDGQCPTCQLNKPAEITIVQPVFSLDSFGVLLWHIVKKSTPRSQYSQIAAIIHALGDQSVVIDVKRTGRAEYQLTALPDQDYKQVGYEDAMAEFDRQYQISGDALLTAHIHMWSRAEMIRHVPGLEMGLKVRGICA